MSKLTSLYKSDYVRPDKGTYQDTLQNKKSMLEKLDNYERVDDIDEVEIKTPVRYVTLHNETKKQVFRLGGILEEINPKYVKISNGEHKWCVQRYHYCDDASTEEPVFETVFWKFVSKEDIILRELEEMKEEFREIKKEIKQFKDELLEKNGIIYELNSENAKLKEYINNSHYD